MSLARESRPDAVKKLTGLSSAELTRLPLARRPWVAASKSAVDWSDRRFCRTDVESTIPLLILLTFLVPRNDGRHCRSTLTCDRYLKK